MNLDKIKISAKKSVVSFLATAPFTTFTLQAPPLPKPEFRDIPSIVGPNMAGNSFAEKVTKPGVSSSIRLHG
jgi:hypothetical protein